MRTRWLVFLMMAGLLGSCGLSARQKQKRQELELERMAMDVMAEHDKQMPKTSQIYKLKRQLDELAKTITDSMELKVLYNHKVELETADEEMMDWMHHYKAADEFLPFEEKKQHYQAEMDKIKEVGRHIDASLAYAQSFLDKYAKQ